MEGCILDSFVGERGETRPLFRKFPGGGGGGGGAQQGIKYEIKGGKTIFHVPKYMISRGMLPRKFLHFGLPEIALSGTTFLMFLVLGACYHD